MSILETPKGIQVQQALACIPSVGNTIDAIVEQGAIIGKAADNVRELVAEISAVTITDEAGSVKMTELLGKGATVKKAIDEARLAVTSPLKARAKAVEDIVRPLTAALDELATEGKKKVSSFLVAERRRREEEERKRQEAIAAAARAALEAEQAAARARAAELRAAEEEKRPVDIMAMMPDRRIVPETPAPLPPAPRGVSTEYGSASLRKTIDFEVVNVRDVPREYLIPDLAKIRQAVRDNPDVVIFGVRVFEVEELAVRGRR